MMDVIAVAKHAMKLGPRETLALHRKRETARLVKSSEEYQRQYRENVGLKKRVVSLEKENRRLSTLLTVSLDRLGSVCLELMEECRRDMTAYPALQMVLHRYFALCEMRGGGSWNSEAVGSFCKRLSELETKEYKARLRDDYLLTRVPKAYAAACEQPVEEKKAVFLQPRKGLNQAFKYMYGYMREHGYGVSLKELCRGDVPLSLYYWNVERFVEEAATAQVVFVHESIDILGHVPIRSESKVVQLWHGCGVFKKIGLDTAGLPGYASRADYEKYPRYNYFSCVTIASPDQSWVFERFMGIDPNAGIIKPLGVSRTDVFFDKAFIECSYKKLCEQIPEAKNKRVVLYAPTYRGVGLDRRAPDELDILQMAEVLSDDWILIVKQHQTVRELPEIPDSVKDMFAYDMTRGRGMDISELMTVADVCVSDYSSLVCEFSLFERPMAFFVPDLEDYVDERGLYYDFDEITPGPLCRTTEELVDYLVHLDERFDRQEVAEFKRKFMGSCDGHSSQRILEYIESD